MCTLCLPLKTTNNTMSIENKQRFKKQINVRLDEDLMRLVSSEVRLRRTTQSQLIRDALVNYFRLHEQSNSN
jgi:hypothetical protein